MNYKVEWSAKSASDLGEHISFQKKISIEAAISINTSIISMGESLSVFPERFPEFPMPANFPIIIRKCVVNNRYIILYGVIDNRVMIFRILDARKKFDGLIY